MCRTLADMRACTSGESLVPELVGKIRHTELLPVKRLSFLLQIGREQNYSMRRLCPFDFKENYPFQCVVDQIFFFSFLSVAGEETHLSLAGRALNGQRRDVKDRNHECCWV